VGVHKTGAAALREDGSAAAEAEGMNDRGDCQQWVGRSSGDYSGKDSIRVEEQQSRRVIVSYDGECSICEGQHHPLQRRSRVTDRHRGGDFSVCGSAVTYINIGDR